MSVVADPAARARAATAREASHSWATRAVWIAVLAVPLLAIAWSWPWRSDAPEPQDLRAALGEPPLELRPSRAFDFDTEPGFCVARLLELLVLATPGGDFKRCALLSFAAACAACAAFAALARRTARGRWPAVGALLFAAQAFSPSFGGDFLLDARFRVIVPEACLLLAALALGTGRGFAGRFALAAVLAQVALFTGRSGVLVWIVLAPVVWLEARFRGRARPLAWLVSWCVLGNLGTAVCYDTALVMATSNPGLMGHLRERPLEILAFLARACAWGSPVPFPSVRALGAAAGAVLVALASLVLWRAAGARADRERLRLALPWLAAALHGIGVACLLGERLYPPPIADATLRELAWGTLLLPAGAVGAAAVLGPPWARAGLRVLAPVWLVLAGGGWWYGLLHAESVHRALRQGEALLVFADTGRAVLPRAPRPPVPDRDTLADLRSRGLLRHAAPVVSLAVDDLGVAAARPDAGGIERVIGSPDGTAEWRVEGVVLDSRAGGAPDLVLLTRGSGDFRDRIFALAAPGIPGPARAWSAEPADREPFREGEQLRAYGFWLDGRVAAELAGSRSRSAAGWTALPARTR